MEKCRCYTEAHLAEGMYCNAKECKYKIIGNPLPRCKINGDSDGPILTDNKKSVKTESLTDKVGDGLSEAELRYIREFEVRRAIIGDC